MKKLDDRLAVAIDYETYYDSKSGYSLTKMTPQQYCSDDRFDAYLVAICGKDIAEETPVEKLSDGRQLYVGRPEKFRDWKKLNGRILLAHNAAFDSVVTDELIKRRLIPALTGCEWKCTADMVAYLACGRSLKTAMKVLYGKEISKEVRSNMDGKHPIQLNAQEMKDLYEYGGSDAVECHDLWLDHCAEWPEIERAISDQNREATKRGVLVDKEYAMTATKELSSYKATIACDVPWYPDKPIGSLPALRAAVLELGIDPPPSFKKDDPRFLEWSEKHSDIPFISARQKAVSVNMHLSRVESIVSSLDADGVTHPQFLYFGAHTGRNSGKSSVGSSNVNMLNMPRKPVLQGDPNVFGGKGVDIRGMYIPRPGHKFAIYDYSQVEARFSLWLAGDTHMIDAIHREGNLYQAAAVQMGWCQSGCDLKHNDPDMYRMAKCCLSSDTLVLTNRDGTIRYRKIIDLSNRDLIWDSNNWVKHEGVIKTKDIDSDELIEIDGAWFTKDHKIYINDTETRCADQVQGRELASTVSWRSSCCPLSCWHEVWVLAVAVIRTYSEVVRAYSKVSCAYCKMFVRRMWKSFRRKLA